MSLESAQQFVSKMKEDQDFRAKVQGFAEIESLKDFLKGQGYDFDERDLVGAMAACMAELNKMMACMTP
jgi:predicted ribosomally synthesized peptide with nif11-like leader